MDASKLVIEAELAALSRKLKRDCDFVLYCKRNLVERFIAAVQLVATIILLN